MGSVCGGPVPQAKKSKQPERSSNPGAVHIEKPQEVSKVDIPKDVDAGVASMIYGSKPDEPKEKVEPAAKQQEVAPASEETYSDKFASEIDSPR